MVRRGCRESGRLQGESVDAEGMWILSDISTFHCCMLSRLCETYACFNSIFLLPQNVKKMVDRIKAFHRLNNHIFATLHKHLANSEVLTQQVREYQPPIYQASGSV